MGMEYLRCNACGEIFCDGGFFMIVRDDVYICESCCKNNGITSDNEKDFMDKDGYLLPKFYKEKRESVPKIKLTK